MNKDEITVPFYQLFKSQISLADFETWLYHSSNIEEVIGSELYLTLIEIKYKAKYARHDVLQLVFPHIPFAYCEKLHLQALLWDIINESRECVPLLEIFYDEYCDGYTFLRYLAFSYLPFTYGEEKDDRYVEQIMPGLKAEAHRLLAFLENGDIQIIGNHEYEDFRRHEDQMELHSLEKMFKESK